VWRSAALSRPAQLFAAAEHNRHCKGAHRINKVVSEQRLHKFGAALGVELRAVLLPQRRFWWVSLPAFSGEPPRVAADPLC
jgi:hypothetical protein